MREPAPAPDRLEMRLIQPRKRNAPRGESQGVGIEALSCELAGWTGLEPAASGVTGRRYNQLNYHPNREAFVTHSPPFVQPLILACDECLRLS